MEEEKIEAGMTNIIIEEDKKEDKNDIIINEEENPPPNNLINEKNQKNIEGAQEQYCFLRNLMN